MYQELLPEAHVYIKNCRRHRIWIRIVSVMACVVIFCTTYALILPAVTLEQQPLCGLTEHHHIELCFETRTVEQETVRLICQPEIHVHTADCWDGEGRQVCGLADILIHTAEAGSCRALTISGGDPLEQPEALLRLLELVRESFDDILVYTGFLLEDIRSGQLGEAARSAPPARRR